MAELKKLNWWLNRFPMVKESDKRLKLEFHPDSVEWGEGSAIKQALLLRMELVGGLVLLDEMFFTGGPKTPQWMKDLCALGLVRRLWRPFWANYQGYLLTDYGWRLVKVLQVSSVKQAIESSVASQDPREQEFIG